MALFFIIFFTVYTTLNYYVFIRGWQFLASYPSLKIPYTFLFIIIAYGYVLAKMLYRSLPPIMYDIIIGVGAIWFAFLAYFIISLLLIDIIRLLNSWLNFFPTLINNNYETVKKITGLSVILIVSLIVFLGNLNKRDIKIKELEIDLPKGNSKISELNVTQILSTEEYGIKLICF